MIPRPDLDVGAAVVAAQPNRFGRRAWVAYDVDQEVV